jgi:hypothetical protein
MRRFATFCRPSMHFRVPAQQGFHAIADTLGNLGRVHACSLVQLAGALIRGFPASPRNGVFW